MTKLNRYVLSDIADQDIGEIYDYTVSNHGIVQAIEYVTGLDARFAALVDQPRMGKARPEIRDGLMSLIYEHHIVFYRIMDDHIRIVRVLHGSRDLPRFF